MYNFPLIPTRWQAFSFLLILLLKLISIELKYKAYFRLEVIICIKGMLYNFRICSLVTNISFYQVITANKKENYGQR